MRCPDCRKFVSFDEPTVELLWEEINDDGTINGEIRIVLTCAECATELKEASLEFDEQIDHECAPDTLKAYQDGLPPADRWEEGNDQYELEIDDPEPIDRYQDTNAKGKPISPRYQKHYYGADISGRAICQKCGETIEFSVQVEEQASGFDEMI